MLIYICTAKDKLPVFIHGPNEYQVPIFTHGQQDYEVGSYLYLFMDNMSIK